MDNESMYYDPAKFDFTSLVDVIETEPEQETPLPKADELSPDGGITDDASDLGHYFEEDEPEEAEEGEPDYNNDVSDLAVVDESKAALLAESVDIFRDLDDSTPLDLDGEPITKGQIKEALKSNQITRDRFAYLEEASRTFEEGNAYIMREMALKQTTLDKNIQYLDNVLSNPNLSGDEYRSFNEQKKPLYR